MSNRTDNDDDHEESFVKNRKYSRRREDVNISSLKLTFKDVWMIITALIAIGGSALHYNSSLEKTQSEMILKYELAITRINSLEVNNAKLEKKVDILEAQTSDLDRTIMQMYTQRRKE